MKNLFADFEKHMNDLDLSTLTMRGYLADLRHFSRWFEQTNAEILAVERVTSTDVKEYKHFLISVEQRKASTVNRHLAAIASLAKWARKTGQIQNDPTENIKGVANV